MISSPTTRTTAGHGPSDELWPIARVRLRGGGAVWEEREDWGGVGPGLARQGTSHVLKDGQRNQERIYRGMRRKVNDEGCSGEL